MRGTTLAVVLLLAPALLLGEDASEGAPAFQIVVNPSVKGQQVSRAVLASIFRCEANRWGDRSLVVPVDQSLRAPVRRAFSQQVLGQTLDGIQAYWTRRITNEGTRIRPPQVRPSDEEVLSFVASHAGAIGYVTADAPLPETVRVVTIVE